MTMLERRGECLKCGICCYQRHSNPALWAKLSASALGEDTRQIDQTDATVVIEDRCYQLDDDNRCMIYETCPPLCKDWPRGVTQLLPGCGYYFLEFHDNDEIAAIHRPGQRRKIV